MIFVIGILCLFLGLVVGRMIWNPKKCGDLRIDNSDPYNGPSLYLELDKHISFIASKKYVTFEVKVKDMYPQD